jgi:hypothetical protein
VVGGVGGRTLEEALPVAHCSIAEPDEPDPERLTLDQYLELLDATGRSIAAGKRGSIDPRQGLILARLDLRIEDWVATMLDWRILWGGSRSRCSRGRDMRTRWSSRLQVSSGRDAFILLARQPARRGASRCRPYRVVRASDAAGRPARGVLNSAGVAGRVYGVTPIRSCRAASR